MDKRGKALIVVGILLIVVLLFGIFVIAGSDDEEKTDDEVIHLNNPGITGGVIGTGLFSGWSFIIIIGIFAGLFALHIISRTILKLKEK